jgi:hypothetical protein
MNIKYSSEQNLILIFNEKPEMHILRELVTVHSKQRKTGAKFTYFTSPDFSLLFFLLQPIFSV